MSIGLYRIGYILRGRCKSHGWSLTYLTKSPLDYCASDHFSGATWMQWSIATGSRSYM